ncbi:MAG: FAD-dependent oxidoreductase [Bacteroidales bacterium]
MVNLLKAAFLLILVVFCIACPKEKNDEQKFDVCIYGGTSAGIVAANSGARLGLKVVVIEPGPHLGGLSSGGLGATDIGNKHAVTGIAREFYRKLGQYYHRFESWTFEPHVAEKIFNEYAHHPNILIIKNFRLKKVHKRNTFISSIDIIPSRGTSFLKGKNIAAQVFIDCSYEGDLMAYAGVSYTIGREDNSVYGETWNGVQLLDKHQFPDSIDPYIIPGDSLSGLVWGISREKLKNRGSGDQKLQAYNFRLCLTQDTGNMIPITAPPGYDPSNFELLRRLIKQREKQQWKHTLNSYLSIIMMPNGKTDINNNGPFSTDLIGGNYEYPEAGFRKRQKIIKMHENYIKGLLYFLGNDPSVPDTLRQQMLSWGYARDEFTDHNGFPHQIYVREARRMIGQYIMTEHNCIGDSIVPDYIGFAAYTMDSHNCQRIVLNGMVKNEGDVQKGGFPPYPISYRSITPKMSECSNLLVPVCLSSSHIAYGSIRMEPVFMVLGQSAAIAASLAIEQKCSVQDIDIMKLQKTLQENPFLNNTPPDILTDNSQTENVTFYGDWKTCSKWMRQYINDYRMANFSEKREKRAFFEIKIPQPGWYAAYYYVPGIMTDSLIPASKVPLRAKGSQLDTIAYLDLSSAYNDWLFIGKYHVASPEKITLEVIADTLSRPAVVDAILFVFQGKID